MTSTFGWLALDPEHRRRMMETTNQFREQSTIDDLGFGGIRDAFADSLFPGTSTLHTRIRYVLFIPWLLQDSLRHDTVSQMQIAFREREYRLIGALKRGEAENGAEGVFGRDAGRQLQRLPSAVYWGALTQWGIISPRFTVRSYFEREILQRETVRTTPISDDPEVHIPRQYTGLDKMLPPPPAGFLQTSSFSLRDEDAQYLIEIITRTTKGSLLARLLTHRPKGWTNADNAPATAGAPEILSELPPTLYELVDRSARFAAVAVGANLLYNLLLAEATGRVNNQGRDLRDVYRNELTDWFAEVRKMRPIDQKDRLEIGHMMAARGRRFTPTTSSFISAWIDGVTGAQNDHGIIDNQDLRDLIYRRERQVKGSRARLAPGNQRALDAWNGASGIGRFAYRWPNVRRHLQDIFDAQDAT